MKNDSLNSVRAIADTLSASLVERDEEVRAILLGLLSREHTLFVGPPGCAKSFLCRSVAKTIDGMKFVDRPLAPTTNPNEVWGPIDPLAYKNEGRYVRRGEGYAPSAHLILLDEFFRASDAICDTLLPYLGPERLTLVDGEQVQAPLLCAVAGSNMFPDNAYQQAILDRWLIRRVIRPVSRAGRARLLFEKLPKASPVTTLEDVLAAGDAAMALEVSDEAKDAYMAIFDELSNEGIRPSDRRSTLSVKVAKAAAFLEGHAQVEAVDLEPLADVLWDVPEQRDKAGEVVVRIANPVGAKLNAVLSEVDQVIGEIGGDSAKRLAAIKKLEASEKEVKKLSSVGNGRATKVLSYVQHEALKLRAAALGISPDKLAALGK